MKKPEIPALTSLRFFAAAAIVLEHSIPYFHLGTAFASKYVLIQGVTFFFVLSGFILTYSQREMPGISGSLRFVYSRISRVWPAHFVTMLLFYVVFVGGFEIAYEPTVSQTLMSLTLTQAWSPLPSDFFAFNGVAWTLSVEMFFYALFPLLVRNFAATWHIKLVFALGLAAFAISIAVNTGAKPFDGADVPSIASWVYILPPAHLIEFVLGMVAAQAWMTYGKLLQGKWLLTAVEIFGCALILIGSVRMPTFGWQLAGAGLTSEAARSWISVSGAAPFYAIALFMLSGRDGLVSRALSWGPMVRLGEISFSMYLVHQPITRALQLHPQWIDWSMPVQFAVYWVATIGVAALLWKVVEKPCQDRMMAVIKRKTPPVQEAHKPTGSTTV